MGSICGYSVQVGSGTAHDTDELECTLLWTPTHMDQAIWVAKELRYY